MCDSRPLMQMHRWMTRRECVGMSRTRFRTVTAWASGHTSMTAPARLPIGGLLRSQAAPCQPAPRAGRRPGPAVRPGGYRWCPTSSCHWELHVTIEVVADTLDSSAPTSRTDPPRRPIGHWAYGDRRPSCLPVQPERPSAHGLVPSEHPRPAKRCRPLAAAGTGRRLRNLSGDTGLDRQRRSRPAEEVSAHSARLAADLYPVITARTARKRMVKGWPVPKDSLPASTTASIRVRASCSRPAASNTSARSARARSVCGC